MVDPDENSIDTAKREFSEEAGNHSNDSDKHRFQQAIDNIYNTCYIGVVYAGYIDEERATDNSWIETTAHLWFINDNKLLSQLQLQSGDDAVDAKWICVDDSNSSDMKNLHANHYDIVLRAKQIIDKRLNK